MSSVSTVNPEIMTKIEFKYLMIYLRDRVNG